MREHFRAGLVGRLTRRLPARRSQVGYWLGKVLMPKTAFIGRFQGGLLEIHPREAASAVTFLMGFYEREVTIWCRELLRRNPPKLVVDVGANFGYYPLLFGLLSAGKTESIAFEPDPPTSAWLERNLKLNPGVRCTVVNKAVGDSEEGFVAFESSRSDHNLWSRIPVTKANEHVEKLIQVPITTLDRQMDEMGIDEVPLTLIDVEGYECQVVQGMARGIAAQRYKTVMVEFHTAMIPDPPAALQGLIDRFAAAGYRAFRFQPFQSNKKSHDKDPAYFRLDWDPKILGPARTSPLTVWEHFLFSCDPAIPC